MENVRYVISGLMILDSEKDPVPEIYIRELLDMPSDEFQRSVLSARQKMDVIQAVGLDALTHVLAECFRQGGKNYDAAQEAEFAVMMLNRMLERNPSTIDAANVSPENQAILSFMQQYFSEQAALLQTSEERSASVRERFFTSDYLAQLHMDREKGREFAALHPAAVAEIKLSGDDASVVTFEPFGRGSQPYIYHLRRTNGSWLIYKDGYECYICNGTGRDFLKGRPCSSCGGLGWRYG